MTTPGKEGASRAVATIDRLFANADRSFLRSAISQEEGTFLEALASRPEVRNTIEVGCANGISSIYICSGIQGKNLRTTPPSILFRPASTRAAG